MRVLLLVFFMLIGASEVSAKDGSDRCGAAFNGREWTITEDTEATALATRFLAQAGIRATPIICSAPETVEDPVISRRISAGFETFFFVGIRADFRLEIGEELRGVIAHEVGHQLTDGTVTCWKYLEVMHDPERYVECEHAADRAADLLAGRGQMKRSLEWLHRFLVATLGARELAHRDELFLIQRRIFLLR